MELKTAFLWDSKNQTINYLICDIEKDFKILVSPHQIPLQTDTFHEDALSTLQKYFIQLQEHNPKKITFEYMILDSDSSDDHSEIIKSKFDESVENMKVNYPIEIAPQMRNLLSGESLHHFKKILKKMGLLTDLRTDAYKWQLWAIFCHATDKDHNLRKNLWRPLIDSIDSERDSKMRYEEWLSHVLKE